MFTTKGSKVYTNGTTPQLKPSS